MNQKFLLRIIILLNIFFVAFFFINCNAVLPAQQRISMGTVCSINLYSSGSQELYDKMFQRLEQIDNLFSVNYSDSAVSKINRAAGNAPVQVPAEVILVLENALQVAKETQGAFDPTIGALVKLWGIGTEKQKVPSLSEISAALELVDYRLVQIDYEASTVFLPLSGMSIDLGGIAKGYAADQLVQIAKDSGIESALFDLGGNIYAYGHKEEGSLWRVGIKNPLQPYGSPLAVLSLSNSTVVTSGTYERFFEVDGIRYHHILNPKTGFPVQGDILSVTILGSNSMLADAFSTAVFVLGSDVGTEFLKVQNCEGIIVLSDKTVFVTDGAREKTEIQLSDFKIQP
ncbi:MAG: FAD:protein FMN transferase [Spirochaetaceae bacterium]|nr:FAD:protein FMN transferase [Spirochaetaceae bacterium]